MNNVIRIFICAAVCVVALSTFGFVTTLQQIPDKDARIAAMNEFKQKYDGVITIRMHSGTGIPASFIGLRIDKYSGTPEQIVRAFLAEEKTMLGINNSDSDIEVIKIAEDRLGSSIKVGQRFNDVPVLHSGYLVSVDKSGAIYFVSGDYYPEVSVNTEPKITGQEASSVIYGDLSGKQPSIKQEPALYIYPKTQPDGTIQYSLIYKATVSATGESWMYYISAENGSIIEKIDMIMDMTINGYGYAYEVSPVYGNTDSVTLQRLDENNNPRLLDGDNVIVYNDTASSEASSSTAEFYYDPDNTHFDEVNAYYHCDEFEMAFLVGEIGMSANQLSDQIPVHTHYQGYSGFDSNTGEINLSDAKASDAITHEYMHAVGWSYSQDWSANYEACAMFEAYSDYFAVAYKNWVLETDTIHTIGEYKYPPYMRILDNSITYQDRYPDSASTYHYNSQIFSGSWWDLRRDNDVDMDDIDKWALSSLNNIDSYPVFLDVRDWLIAYALSHNFYYVDPIEDAFFAHGIFAPLTVEIYGFDYLYEYGRCSWVADVSGGDSPYEYQWYVTNPYTEETEPMPEYYESGNAIEFDLGDLCEILEWEFEPEDYFDLKVVVTDYDQEHADDCIEIEIIEGDPPKMSAKQLPKNFKLEQNYPNPFNPVTTIRFQLPKASNVTLVIYNIQGQEVARLVDGYVEAGYHSIPWKPERAASGIYIYRLQAGNFSDTKRMLYIK